jgi:hypothetical protein
VQVTVRYAEGRVTGTDTIAPSTQHAPAIDFKTRGGCRRSDQAGAAQGGMGDGARIGAESMPRDVATPDISRDAPQP